MADPVLFEDLCVDPYINVIHHSTMIDLDYSLAFFLKNSVWSSFIYKFDARGTDQR